jgi:hypothetical protein
MIAFLPCRVGREKIEKRIDRGAQQTQVIKRKLRLGRQREARGTLLVIHSGMQAIEPSGCGITTRSTPR